jgi:hypothetical protein
VTANGVSILDNVESWLFASAIGERAGGLYRSRFIVDRFRIKSLFLVVVRPGLVEMIVSLPHWDVDAWNVTATERQAGH